MTGKEQSIEQSFHKICHYKWKVSLGKATNEEVFPLIQEILNKYEPVDQEIINNKVGKRFELITKK